ncbi:MAG: hypothetical protein ABFC57_13155 [Veillonellales bacterium]
MEGRTEEQLWLDFRFLTKEMAKFLAKDEMELFYDLLRQRGELQSIIAATPESGFKETAPGKTLLTEIWQANQLLTHNLQFRVNKGKQQQRVSNAYDGRNTAAASSRMSWKR